jgi:hypothetical protein
MHSGTCWSLMRRDMNIYQFQTGFLSARPPLWSSGQNSWLQIQRSGFHSRRYQIFWEIASLERGLLSLVGTTEELLERKSSGYCLEIRECGRRDPSRWPRGSLCPQKLALTSRTSGGRSVGIVRSRTLATDSPPLSTQLGTLWLSTEDLR